MSYHVLIKAKNDPSLIEAPVWLATREEAESFGKLSIKILSWYANLEAWKIIQCNQLPNYEFADGELAKLNQC